MKKETNFTVCEFGFVMAVKVSLKEMIQTGAHFGHQSRRWNPKVAEYIHGTREGVHIFDLIKTKNLLESALDVIEEAAKKGKSILLVGTKKQAKLKIDEVAEASGVYSITERWLGGTLTNFEQIKRSVNKLLQMKSDLEKGAYKKLTKKERLLKRREIDRLERFFGGISGITALPDLIVIVDIKKEKSAVSEAKAKGITTVAIVDSNCDPTTVDYPIPMNDDATKAIEYVLDLVKEAILEGKGKVDKQMINGQINTRKNEKKSVKKLIPQQVRSSQIAKSAQDDKAGVRSLPALSKKKASKG